MGDSGGPQLSDDGRFWLDGDRWRPMPDTPVAVSGGPSVGKIVAGILIAVIIIIAGLWIINSLVHSDDAVQCATENADRAQRGDPLLDCPAQ